jgi:hypothetical protein
MERRLLKAIVNPSMILVLLTGFSLVYLTGDWRDGWWQAKFILVLGLAGLHGYFARCVRSFAEDRRVLELRGNPHICPWYLILSKREKGSAKSARSAPIPLRCRSRPLPIRTEARWRNVSKASQALRTLGELRPCIEPIAADVRALHRFRLAVLRPRLYLMRFSLWSG